VWGLANGYCLMVGAEPETFAVIEPAIATLAPDGYRTSARWARGTT
jgi:6-phosphogluconate dehydrogenase